MAVRAVSQASVDLPFSAVWDITVSVRDADRCLTDAVTPVVTVTLPDGSTATPTVDRLALGTYRATHTTASAGRYVARAVAAGYGAADFTAYVSAVTTAAGMPTLVDLRGDPEDPEDLGYLGENSWTDEEIQDALDAEAAAQRAACRVPAAYPDDLRQALLRRVQRNLNMRRLPLSYVPGSESEGTTNAYPGLDREIRRFEAPHRRLVMG